VAAEEELYKRFGREFPKGHLLFNDGEPGREMFVIQAGKVRISKRVREVEKTLVTLGAGEFFGEMSILNNRPRSATATVEEDAKLLVIEPKVFEAMVRGNTEIAVRMIKKLAQRLQEADEQIENLLHQDYNSRVVHFLAHSASKTGRQIDQGIAVDLTQKELASKVGLDNHVVDDVVNKLIRAKLVSIIETGLVVQNVERLREFLEFLEMKEKFGNI